MRRRNSKVNVDAIMNTITRRAGFLAAAFFAASVLLAEPAHAMHISDGVLPPSWAAFWWALAIPFVVIGIKAYEKEKNGAKKPFIGLIGSAVFIISCMPVPVPVAGSCSHPCGTGLAALLIGPKLTVAISSVALVLQALFLAHGGITTMGANIFSMGVAGAFSGYFVFRAANKLGLGIFSSTFLAGLVSDWATYAVTSLELASGLGSGGSAPAMFGALLAAFAPTQIPLGIMEGFVTASAFKFITERRPDLSLTPVKETVSE